MSLSISEFKMTSAVCEIRYDDAYLVYDRTGQICHELKAHFSGFKVQSPSPSQTTGSAKEGTFVLETAASRFSTKNPDTKLEQFAVSCKQFFDSVTTGLEVKVFTRIGLRIMYRKDFRELEEAKSAFTAMKLTTLTPSQRFGAADEPNEIYLRWEGKDVGTTWRAKAEDIKIDVVLPPEIEAEKSELHKVFNALVVDVDYYTVAPVEKSQWDPKEWIQHSIRTIRRETDVILGN
jgi:hypothetical protein